MLIMILISERYSTLDLNLFVDEILVSSVHFVFSVIFSVPSTRIRGFTRRDWAKTVSAYSVLVFNQSPSINQSISSHNDGVEAVRTGRQRVWNYERNFQLSRSLPALSQMPDDKLHLSRLRSKTGVEMKFVSCCCCCNLFALGWTHLKSLRYAKEEHAH